MRAIAISITVLVALGLISSGVIFPMLGGGFDTHSEEGVALDETGGFDDGLDETGGFDGGLEDDGAPASGSDPDRSVTGPGPDLRGLGDVELEPTTPGGDVSKLAQVQEDAVEAGVDRGIELVQLQGVDVSQEQRAAAIEGALESAAQHQEADVEQIQNATAGAVHGTLVQDQRVEAEQVQAAVAGATDGALAQYQTATATQMQSAAWGATHGAIAQKQIATVEQIQVATRGAAAGAAAKAGETDAEAIGKVQEAAQGAAYGAVEQYQKITVEQRQHVTLEHVQYAAAGASAGALEGAMFLEIEQEQRIEIEQYQQVTIKGVQKAAMGAAKGALVQTQTVTVEQTQAAAFGAGKGALEQFQTVRIEQVQRITITQIQEASFGAAKGAIYQSQEATIEQIQAAAVGGSGGVLVQQQEVTVAQTQQAAFGASKGAVVSAVQHQVVDVEQIQAAAFGAGEGAVIQKQVVDLTQIQALAEGASAGVLSQAQVATVEQLQVAARSACEATAVAIQYQRVSVTQLQVLVESTAADTTAYAADTGVDDLEELIDFATDDASGKVEEVEEMAGEATISISDQDGDGETIVVDRVDLSEGGFVVVHDDAFFEGESVESVRGVSAYLEPGEHENVEVEFEERLEENRTVTAVAHLDTTGDETFEYVETDGDEDVPYVDQVGAPIFDDAFVTVEEPVDPDEIVDDPDGIDSAPEAVGALEVVDFQLAGDDPDEEFVTLQNVANDTLEMANWTVQDREGDGLVDTDVLSPYTFPEGFTLEPDGTVTLVTGSGEDTNDTLHWEVDRPVWNESGDTIIVLDAAGSVILEESLEPDLPEATLSVVDQEGDGETLVVDEANASVEYVLTVSDEDGERLAESDPIGADVTSDTVTLELEPPIVDDATIEVAVRDAADDDILANETIEYALEDVPEETEVEFLECTRVEISGTFEEGDEFIVGQTAYFTSGIGTSSDYSVSFGVDEAPVNVDAPFTGTVVVELGEAYAIVEETDEEVLVEVPAAGSFGSTISGLEPTPGSDVFDGETVSNPQTSECLADGQPEEPSIAVEDVTPNVDVLEVSFSYDNPNDDALSVGSSFVEGATDDEPPTTLDPGEETFTIEWQPATDGERLVWEVDLTAFDYEEPLRAETGPASEYLPEPAEEPDDEGPEEPDDEGPEEPDDEEPEDDSDDEETEDDSENEEPEDDLDEDQDAIVEVVS